MRMKAAPLSLLPATLMVVAAFLLSCAGTPEPSPSAKFNQSSIKITKAFIPEGRLGRHKTRFMRPRYITIHSTQNFGGGADARTHARLLQRGGLKSGHNSLEFLTWHFTVDGHGIYQSLPTTKQGQHAH